MLLKACLNGCRLPDEHPLLPVTPEQLAVAASAVVDAGASALHIHPKQPDGNDTLAEPAVSEAVRAVRAAVPGVPVGVTTGAWMMPHPSDRVDAVRRWRELPDFASVNWHEPGAAQVADTLMARGIGVEAGLWHEAAVEHWRTWPRQRECLRVLLEVVDAPGDGIDEAHRLLRALGDAGALPILLHGQDATCWPVFHTAISLGLDVRIGLEDTLHLPGGAKVEDNRTLVEAAVRAMSGSQSPPRAAR